LMDPLGLWVAAALTLLVYSYLFADNPLYRLVEHLFIAVALGYAAVVTFHTILGPRLIQPLIEDPSGNWHLIVPLILGVLLLSKASPSFSWLGSASVAYLFGVGVALGIGGALAGSILPQVGDTMISLWPDDAGGWGNWVNQIMIAVGTLATLAYFYFTWGVGEADGVGRRGVSRWVASIGRYVIMLTFGAIFANTIMARVSLLVGRINFLLGDWLNLL